MTDSERAKALRNELKEKGYNSRRVGVTLKYAGYETIIRVTIKEREIDKKEIETIARKYKAVYYDERTGEVLQGGNTFVSVGYDYKLTA